MLGGFKCPHCKTYNACDCKTCKPHITEEDFVPQRHENGEALKCGKCGEWFSYDQAAEEEMDEWYKLKSQEEQTEK